MNLLIQEGSKAESIELDVRWSYTTPAPVGIRPVTVRADYTPVFREAGQLYRAKGQPRTSVITGSVFRLQRGHEDPVGRVTVRANFGETTHLVKIDLTGDDYHNAVDAHDKKLPIMAEGTLVKGGRYYPSSISLHFAWSRS